LIKTEGILCGGSSGSALSGVIQFLTQTEEGKKLNREGKNVVVILADSIRNYVTSSWLAEVDEATPPSSPATTKKDEIKKEVEVLTDKLNQTSV